jgi:hypothetical protein
MPAPTRRAIASGEDEEGPIVQTIFVLRGADVTLSR